MSSRPLVTVVGATGAQGGAVVRGLIQTGKYKIRALTRDPTSEKAQALQRLSSDIELVRCDITNADDVQHKPEIEVKQGTIMADAAGLLQVPYYIFSMTEDIPEELKKTLYVPHITQKAKIHDYITEKYPNLKTIFIELGPYMQIWTNFAKVSKLNDGTIVFPLPVAQETKLYMIDVDNLGDVVREILENPENYVGKVTHMCGEQIRFDDVSKTFTKVTGIPAVSKTLTKEEFAESLHLIPKKGVDDLWDMYKFFEIRSSHGTTKDWTNGQKITKLNTFEEWLRKTGWKGE